MSNEFKRSPSLKEIASFLNGSAALDGVWFSEKHPDYEGMYWWRPILAKAIQEASPAPDGEVVAWVQAEPCVTLADLHSDHFELIHSARFHFGKKPPTKNQDANKLFALFTAPPRVVDVELLKMLVRIRDDKTWRTNDNSLWPDLLALIRKHESALEQSK